MNGTHITVCVAGASAGLAARAAALAERWALDSFWVGDPSASAPNRDDNYVVTALAGIAASTSDIRLGAVLSLPDTSVPLRIAEDIGVVDTASRGRLELALLVSPDPDWEARATSLLTAFHTVPLPDGRTVSVHPKPH
ncbi:MAG: hypothetical protein JWN62_834, partial [Acidimicrobiales bacterium]|nr:hypothetical protein [Acidimicrobiales bacterium]